MNKADFSFVRERMRNVCDAGHEQPVHHYHCGICGSIMDREYDEQSWDKIDFNQKRSFRILHDAELADCDNAFFSLFNDNLLVLTSHGKVFLIQEISSLKLTETEEEQSATEAGEEKDKEVGCIKLPVQEFQLSTLRKQINKIVTDNRNIYILSDSKLFLLDWLDLLNQKSPVTQIKTADDVHDIIRGKHIHAFTDKSIFSIQGTQTHDLFVAPDGEKILAIDIKNDDLLILSTTPQEGDLAVRTNNYNSSNTISKEILMKSVVIGQAQIALGNGYYAISPDQSTVVVGKLSGLRSSRDPIFRWTRNDPIQRMFFVKEHLYLFSGGILQRWDMLNFTTDPDARASNLNIIKHDPSINADSSLICAPIMTSQNDSLAILDLWLRQVSISAGFSDKLIAFSVMDNHIFALTKGNKTTSIYIG